MVPGSGCEKEGVKEGREKGGLDVRAPWRRWLGQGRSTEGRGRVVAVDASISVP